MRIERQGTIETQPVYSHVGYTAAAMIANMAGPVLGLCALTPIALAVGLMVARRTRRVWGVGAALAMLAPAAVWCGVGYEKGRAGLEALGVHTALYVLEQTCEDIGVSNTCCSTSRGRMVRSTRSRAISCPAQTATGAAGLR